MRISIVILFLALLGVNEGFGAERITLDPKRVHSVIAGVLKWKDSGLSSFSSENRKDLELDQTLGRMGVPASQRQLLLDEQASRAEVIKALDLAVSRAPAGSTLLFYYAGHGLKKKTVIFATNDISTSAPLKTGLTMADISSRIAKFKGERVILLADCCYSGGLAEVARSNKGSSFRLTVLSSASSSNISTGNWTFTQNILDGFRGRYIFDADRDGKITLAEIRDEIKDAMKHREGQRSGWVDPGGNADWVVAPVAAETGAAARFPADRWFLANHPKTGRKAPARILNERPFQGDKGGKTELELAFYDYSLETRAWIPAALAEKSLFKTWPASSALRVRWKKEIYDAKVTQVDDGFMYITYPGWDSEWDEWITAERVVESGVSSSVVVPAAKKKLSVRWKEKWYDAELMRMDGKKYCIHYVGFESSWDECVGPDRVRDLK